MGLQQSPFEGRVTENVLGGRELKVTFFLFGSITPKLTYDAEKYRHERGYSTVGHHRQGRSNIT